MASERTEKTFSQGKPLWTGTPHSSFGHVKSRKSGFSPLFPVQQTPFGPITPYHGRITADSNLVKMYIDGYVYGIPGYVYGIHMYTNVY